LSPRERGEGRKREGGRDRERREGKERKGEMKGERKIEKKAMLVEGAGEKVMGERVRSDSSDESAGEVRRVR
jgi:hypothetical protein